MTTKNLDTPNRFSFGKNWSNLLKYLTQERILEAEKSLKEKLNMTDLKGKTFLDVGSGSGLFSLAAHKLGAKVMSFDYDLDSVQCALYLKEKHSVENWSIEQGSVLDKDFLNRFGQVDIVYSWGVLHHTGHMYVAFENIAKLVKPEGKLFISIYNDQGLPSKIWLKIKKSYVSSNMFVRFLLVLYTTLRLWGPTFTRDFIKHLNPLKTWINYGKNNRGMSAYYDVIDWVGGYPFEVATPEEVFYFFQKKGFSLKELKTCSGGLGCNEFVFQKCAE